MQKLLAAGAILLALALPASAQLDATTPGGLPTNVTPIRYDITVTPDIAGLTLAGEVSIDIELTAPTREIVLNVLDLTFDRVQLDHSRLRATTRFDTETQTAHISFPSAIPTGRHTLTIAYRGTIYRQAQGLFAIDYDAAGGQERMLVSQFEVGDARRFVPCWDEPSVKAIFDLTVVVPEDRVVISNMPEANVERSGGMKRVRFQSSPKMSSYLLFLGVGDFERISTRVEGVEISVYTKRGSAEMGRFALDAAAQLLPYFNEYFATPYPLPKLDIIAAPGTSSGFAAMENWGAILFFEEYSLLDPALTSEAKRQFIYTTVAHEVSHMWFGNLVTMAWWDDLWLNEGFATWMENKASDVFHPEWNVWLQAQNARQGAMNLDARASTQPIIVPVANVEQANQAFDQIAYQKGFSIVRMFEMFVGEEAFRDGVRAYMRDHAYANARSADLWSAVQQASGRPLRRIADDLTLQAGIPLITAETGPCRSGRQSVTLRQSEFTALPITRAPLLWHTPVTVTLLSGRGGAEVVTDETHAASLDLQGCGAFIVNPGQIGYYRVRYPQAAFDRLARDFARIPAADQLGLLYDARALGRAGQISAFDVLALARRTPRNADPLVWNVIAGEIAAMDGLFGDDPRRAQFRTFARQLLNPVFAQIGWAKRDGESDNASLLRATLIVALSSLQDPRFEAEALRRYQANQIDGPVRAAVLNAVGAAATRAMFDDLLARARASTDTLEKDIYYEALAQTRDPVLAARVLEIAFEPDVQTALGPQLIGYVAGAHTALAWDYASAHPDELAARIEPFTGRSFLPSLAVASNDPAMLTRVRAYIDANVPQTARRAPDALYAQLEERLSTRARRLDDISAGHGRSR